MPVRRKTHESPPGWARDAPTALLLYGDPGLVGRYVGAYWAWLKADKPPARKLVCPIGIMLEIVEEMFRRTGDLKEDGSFIGRFSVVEKLNDILSFSDWDTSIEDQLEEFCSDWVDEFSKWRAVWLEQGRPLPELGSGQDIFSGCLFSNNEFIDSGLNHPKVGSFRPVLSAPFPHDHLIYTGCEYWLEDQYVAELYDSYNDLIDRFLEQLTTGEVLAWCKRAQLEVSYLPIPARYLEKRGIPEIDNFRPGHSLPLDWYEDSDETFWDVQIATEINPGADRSRPLVAIIKALLLADPELERIPIIPVHTRQR